MIGSSPADDEIGPATFTRAGSGRQTVPAGAIGSAPRKQLTWLGFGQHHAARGMPRQVRNRSIDL
jgi:hypothetical protein